MLQSEQDHEPPSGEAEKCLAACTMMDGASQRYDALFINLEIILLA